MKLDVQQEHAFEIVYLAHAASNLFLGSNTASRKQSKSDSLQLRFLAICACVRVERGIEPPSPAVSQPAVALEMKSRHSSWLNLGTC